MFTLTGQLRSKKETQQISQKFKKRDFILEDTTGQYPNPIPMQFTGTKCSLLDAINEGDEIKVEFFIKGNEVEGKDGADNKIYANLEAYRIMHL